MATLTQEGQPVKIMQRKHKAVSCICTALEFERILNRHFEEGWRLIQVTVVQFGACAREYLAILEKYE